jgi:hypothetical protein
VSANKKAAANLQRLLSFRAPEGAENDQRE